MLRFSESLPASSTHGMISSEGSDESIWISRCEVCGKILSRSPRIGEMASPGSDLTDETDQMATSVASEIIPRPVWIVFFINVRFES